MVRSKNFYSNYEIIILADGLWDLVWVQLQRGYARKKKDYVMA